MAEMSVPDISHVTSTSPALSISSSVEPHVDPPVTPGLSVMAATPDGTTQQVDLQLDTSQKHNLSTDVSNVFVHSGSRKVKSGRGLTTKCHSSPGSTLALACNSYNLFVSVDHKL